MARKKDREENGAKQELKLEKGRALKGRSIKIFHSVGRGVTCIPLRFKLLNVMKLLR
jgi:hypothetical protein